MLFPTKNSFDNDIKTKLKKRREESNFIGDGRSNSSGYSDKYGSSLMSTDLNKRNDFFVVHVSTAGNSSSMLQSLLKKHSNSIKVTILTTDRPVQIRVVLEKEYEILYQFDAWHFGKPVKEKKF